jgi:hypothetical protein
MKKKNILLLGVLALGSYLFWRYSRPKKNFTSLHRNDYKEEPIQDNLSKFGMPRFGRPEYIVKN